MVTDRDHVLNAMGVATVDSRLHRSVMDGTVSRPVAKVPWLLPDVAKDQSGRLPMFQSGASFLDERNGAAFSDARDRGFAEHVSRPLEKADFTDRFSHRGVR
jgi:hypothetical protein